MSIDVDDDDDDDGGCVVGAVPPQDGKARLCKNTKWDRTND
jgi:hypothetical protein